MSKELQISTRNIPATLQHLSRKPIVQYLEAGKMDKVSGLMPSTVEKAMNGTPVAMVAQVVDPLRVEAFVAFELTKRVADMFNGDQRLNLQGHQIPLIARSLMENFRNESLADFSVCFQRGVAGFYGELYRIDLAVITGWMQKYLEEKYQAIESKLMSEK